MQVNGAELFVDDDGEGPPLLLHHGYNGSHDDWARTLPILRRRFRCIAMDCRGAGDSEDTSDGYTLEQLAADVIGVADRLELPSFTYVGHSMGGGVGMLLALEHAERLDRLVLVAPIPSGPSGRTRDPARRQYAQRIRRDRDAEAIERTLRALIPGAMPDEVLRRSAQRELSVSDGHFERLPEAMRSFDVSDRLHEITTPTLVVSGAADALLQANLRDFARLPYATLHVFSRCWHVPQLEAPEAFADVVGDFMEHGVVNSGTQLQRMREVAGLAPPGDRVSGPNRGEGRDDERER